MRLKVPLRLKRKIEGNEIEREREREREREERETG